MLGADWTMNINAVPGRINAVYAGLHYRNSRSEGMNSAVFIGGVSYNNINVVLSYDEYFNADNYSSAIGTSFEISIIYTGINSLTDQFSLPCEVY